MFLKRLTWFWVLLTGLACVLAGRLVDIQVVHAGDWENLALRLLTRQPRYQRAPRGHILDRRGRVLVSDQPSSDVCVHYAVLTGRSQAYLRALARGLRKRGEFPPAMSVDAITAHFRRDISDMWQRLAELTGQPVREFIERGERVRAQVDRVRAAVRRRTGVDQPVAEERDLHPVIENVSDDVALAVRLELERLPWLKVVPGSRRVVHDADAVVHLLGRLGAVGPEDLERDPWRGDELRALRPGDVHGISGVERLTEPTLRGSRGRIVEDLDGTLIEHADPIQGKDVMLTLDMPLQEYVLGRLQATIESPDADHKLVWPAGGSAVVIDVATREVLALVSHPVYRQATFHEDYAQLRRDAIRTPLRFRAVASQYPPGSTCKAITLVGALAEHLVTENEHVHCTGHLLPEQPDRFRCWIYNQYRVTHDAAEPEGQAAEDAVRNSCNIYFYKMGDRLGPPRLCEWFARFGFGRTPGTGLVEESTGIVPTEDWLRRTQNRGFERADAWNWSIGQGEVTATPLQVANVCASIAAGYWARVRVLRDHVSRDSDVPTDRIELPEHALRVLRTGMWRVVNEPGGTAYKYARLEHPNYVFCGKTGSAQAPPQPVKFRYTFEWPDGRRAEAVAYEEDDARRQADAADAECVGKHTVERYPDLLPGELSAHAWFMGYTQPASTPRGHVPAGGVYAIAVVIEHGQSGGSVAGPIAKQIADWLLQNEQ